MVEERKVTPTLIQPTARKKRWRSMTLTFVGSVGAVMQAKTGPTPDTGQGGPFHS
jgi:hypothetical protein